MNGDLVPDDLWARVAPLLPRRPERRQRHAGRHRIADRIALAGILYVLRTGVAWRDVRRPHDYGIYDADLAHHRCRERAGRPKLASDPELKAEVQSKLDLEWSPEQIASHLRTRWPDHPGHLCHETI
jgi:IS30 family transposase